MRKTNSTCNAVHLQIPFSGKYHMHSLNDRRRNIPHQYSESPYQAADRRNWNSSNSGISRTFLKRQRNEIEFDFICLSASFLSLQSFQDSGRLIRCDIMENEKSSRAKTSLPYFKIQCINQKNPDTGSGMETRSACVQKNRFFSGFPIEKFPRHVTLWQLKRGGTVDASFYSDSDCFYRPFIRRWFCKPPFRKKCQVWLQTAAVWYKQWKSGCPSPPWPP